MLDDMVWYRSTKIALYGPSGGTGIFFRQVLMLFECSEPGLVSRSRDSVEEVVVGAASSRFDNDALIIDIRERGVSHRVNDLVPHLLVDVNAAHLLQRVRLELLLFQRDLDARLRDIIELAACDWPAV